MRRRIIAPMVLATVLVAAGCGDSSKPSSSATTTPPSAASTMPAASTSAAPASGSVATPAPSTLTVTIKDFKFGPADLTVPLGSEVSFMNADNQTHTVTDAGKFDTSGIQAGATAKLTFDTAGTFTYMCALHPFMSGTITVA